eukprot:EG_transcript_10737
MRYARAGAQRPSTPSQASANKLRIFQLVPSAHQYDVVVMLDADIMVLANFLRLIGLICRDTLYTVSHRFRPEAERQLKFFQSRDFTDAEMSHVKAKDLVLFNAGQFVFRPSVFMEKLFWKAYQSYKQDPLATLYEQGHMNTVFLLECNVKFTLTHITLLGSTPAASARVPGEYALIHVCEVKITPEQKLAIMRRFLGTAFRPLEAVQHAIVPRLWRCLDTSLECGFYSRPSRRARRRSRATAGRCRADQPDAGGACAVGVDNSLELTAAYAHFVSQPDVTHMCDVGFRRGRTAAIALSANPSAGLTIFSNTSSADSTLGNLRAVFPSRIIHLAGTLQESLLTYSSMVSAGRHPPCSSLLLPEAEPDGPPWSSLQTIMAPPGRVFVAGAKRPLAWAAATPDGPLQEAVCQNVSVQGRQGWWCRGRLLSSHVL